MNAPDGIRPLSPPGPRWSNWYLTMPKLAVGLLLVMLMALLWLLRENETEEQREILIADALWMEQNLRFHLDGNTDLLQQLALDLAHKRDDAALFRTRARHLLKNNPELTQIAWLDARGRMLHALPTADAGRPVAETADGNSFDQAFEFARRLGKPTYTGIYRLQQAVHFEVYVPLFDGEQFRGMLVGAYSLDTLLGQLVPWWFAEKYQLRIIDQEGAVLAAKSKVDAGALSVSHQMPLDPPGQGLALQITAYRGATSPAQALIIAVIVFLAGAVFWSLWAIRGLIRRRLAAEQALRAEHAFRKAMEDSLTVGMRARDLEGRITYVNPAFCRMVGFPPGELIGEMPPMSYWAPEEMEKTVRLHQAVLEGRAPREGFELRFMRKNGQRFDALVYEAPLIDADGRHTGWMGSVLDVTERKQAEELARQQQEKLQRTSRLVTMGEMASTLAHELNQPLAAIASYNTGCLNRLADADAQPAELKGALEKLGLQARRAGRIIRRVHDFVRKSEPRRAPCELEEVIEDSIGFIESEARKRRVRIERRIPAQLPPILADRVMLEQVLLNLMRNALEAMQETPPEARELTVAVAAHESPNKQIEIRVADRGGGMPPDVVEKLFTPFFTTKPEGMGMGLSICRSIVEFHHGRLWVEAHADGGSVFVFTLPVE